MDGSITRITLSDGSTRYRARYRDPGGRQHERRFARKVDAQRWLDEATSALVTQTWTAPERGRVTVADWADRWLSSQTGVKPSTLYRYGNLLRTHVLPSWGRHRLVDVTHADVAVWVAGLLTQGSAPGTVRQAHRVFSLLLGLAVRDGRIPRNPAERVPLPRVTRQEPRFLTHDEVERLADAANEDGDVIRLLAYTGLRFGEMAALRVRRIDFLRRRLTIAEAVTEVGGRLEFGTPKTHQQRTVPLPATLAESLARHCAAASLAVASGATVKSVQRMLGHASAAMTLDVYSGLFDDDLTALADRMDAAARAAADARVGAVWARPPAETRGIGKRAGQRGGPRGDRTHNPRIKSPLLCQLS